MRCLDAPSSLLFALASLKLPLIRLILEWNSAALGVSTAVTVYKSYEKASKYGRCALHSTLDFGQLGTPERIADEIGHAGQPREPNRTTEVNATVSSGIYGLATAKSEDTRLHSAADDVHMEDRGSSKCQGGFKAFREGLKRGGERTFLYVRAGARRVRGWCEEKEGSSGSRSPSRATCLGDSAAWFVPSPSVRTQAVQY